MGLGELPAGGAAEEDQLVNVLRLTRVTLLVLVPARDQLEDLDFDPRFFADFLGSVFGGAGVSASYSW